MPGKARKGQVTKAKAKEILKHGSVGGKRLTPRQKKFFGFMAGGGVPTKTRR